MVHVILCCVYISLFTWSKQKWFFWRASFFPANQGFLKTFQIVLIGWIKASPPKKSLLFWLCKQAIICTKSFIFEVAYHFYFFLLFFLSFFLLAYLFLYIVKMRRFRASVQLGVFKTNAIILMSVHKTRGAYGQRIPTKT